MMKLSRLSNARQLLQATQFGVFTREKLAPSLALTIRGPKKQKEKGGAKKAEGTACIINIFKEGADPLIYPSDAYPPWVMELLNEEFNPDDVMLQMYRGERLPRDSE